MLKNLKPLGRILTGFSTLLMFAFYFQVLPIQLASQSRLATLVTSRASTTIKASFRYSPSFPTLGQAVQFTDTSTGNLTSWQWDFGDGTTSTVRNPSHTYTSAGFRKIILIASNGSSSKRSSRTITVMPAHEAATFVFSPTAPGPGQTVQFADTSSGNPTSWKWDFGDGATSTSKDPSHVYLKAASYTVNLISSNSSGSKQGSKTINVTSISVPSSSFSFTPALPSAGQAVQFTDTSTGSPSSWQWDFGDGSTSTAQNPSHAYTTAGSKTVTLTVTNSSGTNSASRTVTVGAALVASFSFSPASPTTGQSVQFTDTSVGSPTAWSWSFGDGSTSTARNPSHAYATAGSKTVTLTVTNSSGSNSASRTVAVVTTLTASFSFSPASPTAGQSVQFTDTSTGSPSLWQWSFGDGTTSTAQNPGHAFVSAGSYNITLSVMNTSGQSSIDQTITVALASTLIAAFTFNPASPAPGRTVQFADTSTGTPTSWQWSFGDGSTSTAQNPSHAYASAGSYAVTMIASNASDSDTTTQTVSVMTSDLLPDDRIIDWTYAGVPGGIPARTTTFRTLGPGATAAEINAAVTAASGSGQVVFLAAGTYNINALIDIGSVTGVTIRGAGAGRTIINSTAGGTDSIVINPRGYIDAAISGGTNIASGYTKGSTSITLASTPPSLFRVGNLIQIVQDDDYILVFHRTNNWAGNRNLRHTSRITGVNGNVVTFATPIPHSFHAAYHPQANAMSAGAVLVGIEDLTVVANNKSAITFGGADRCWVKGVETIGTGNSSIEFRSSLQCEVRRCYIHDAYGYPDQSDGYGIFLFYGSGYCRVEDNIGHRMANLVMMNGASGNAILYNFSRSGAWQGLSWISPSINCNHGPHGIMNLFEGNIIAAFQNDGYHGSTSHGMLFRNQIHGLDPDGWTQERRLVDLCRGSYYHTVVGNVIGDASWNPNYYDLTGDPGHDDNGCIYILGYPNMGNTHLTPETTWQNYTVSYPDRKVADTLLRHGNYDYYNKGVVWDDDISSRVIPDSLFYASKPLYFGSLQWPPIGPDVNGLVGGIPAKLRWDAYYVSGNLDDLLRD